MFFLFNTTCGRKLSHFLKSNVYDKECSFFLFLQKVYIFKYKRSKLCKRKASNIVTFNNDINLLIKKF